MKLTADQARDEMARLGMLAEDVCRPGNRVSYADADLTGSARYETDAPLTSEDGRAMLSHDDIEGAVGELADKFGLPVEETWAMARGLAGGERSVEGLTTAVVLLSQMPEREILALSAAGHDEHGYAVGLAGVSAADRTALARKGWALPDGSFPIPDKAHLHSAAVLAASGHGDVKAARALIRRRARDLGVNVNSLPGFHADDDDAGDDHADRGHVAATSGTLSLTADGAELTALDCFLSAVERGRANRQADADLIGLCGGE